VAGGYLELIDSFKEHQISKLLRTIRERIVLIVKDKHISERVNDYFNEINEEGEPFTDFAKEPAQISQIKKTINALYHAELAFIDLEAVELRNGNHKFHDVSTLYANTIHHSYQASYLLTHLDIDLKEILQKEFGHLVPLIEAFKTFAKENSNQATTLANQLKEFPLSYNVGLVAGIGVDQLQPNGGNDVDYGFITQFGASLPGYLDKFTAQIRQLSSQVTENEPNLDQSQINNLQEDAIKLLYSIEGLQGDGLMASLRVLNYIHILRHTITLSTSIVEQMGHLSGQTQDIIREKLAQLKYQVLPELFSVADKLEDHGLLTPGTLTQPLMDSIKPLYAILIEYAQKPVDFSQKGGELLRIEDLRFIQLRLKKTYQRIDDANAALFKIQKAQKAYEHFFKILEKPKYQGLSLSKLPQVTKNALVNQYKLLQPYVSEIDGQANQLIIDALTREEGHLDTIVDTVGLGGWYYEDEKISKVLQFKKAIEKSIEKSKQTYEFHIELNQDLIESVYERANIKLLPFAPSDNVFEINECQVIDGEASELEFQEGQSGCEIKDKRTLNADKALRLHQHYKSEQLRLTQAQSAYHNFMQILRDNPLVSLNAFDEDKKATLSNLYTVFQPYFFHALEPHCLISYYDKRITHDLSNVLIPGTEHVIQSAITVKFFEAYDYDVTKQFSHTLDRWGKQSEQYHKLADNLFSHETNMANIEREQFEKKRKNYLIKHTDYSKAIADFKKSFFEIKHLFNASLQDNLTAQKKGVPFPEIEDKNLVLQQAKQVVGMKRLYNCLYHLEQISLQLEQLNEKSYQSVYVSHLLMIYNHLNEIYGNGKALLQDPHYSALFNELLDKAKKAYEIIDEQSKPYITRDEGIDLPEVQYGGMRVAINGFLALPQHIRVSQDSSGFSQEQINALHYQSKETALKIESIIQNSDSYFRLLLKTPAMLSLYNQFNQKLSEFSSTTHTAVVDNIEAINNDIFSQILIETDKWEDVMGLKPGTLSHTMKSVLDEFYKGLATPLIDDSKQYLSFVHSMEPINKRMLAVAKRQEAAKTEFESTAAGQLEVMTNYFVALDVYKGLAESSYKAPDKLLSEVRQSVVTDYAKIYKNLHHGEFNADYFLSSDSDGKDIIRDEELLNKVNALLPHVEHEKHALLGAYNSYQIEEQTSKEKLNYLNELKATQQRINTESRKQYCKSIIDKKMDSITARYVGLSTLNKEYNAKLIAYFTELESQIIEQAQFQDDIHHAIDEMMKEKVAQFDREHLIDYYHLEIAVGRINQFTNYIQKEDIAIRKNHSLFESTDTITKKAHLLQELRDISEDTSLSARERMQQLKEKTDSNQFKYTMLRYKTYQHFSFNWLKTRVISFLEHLHLYERHNKKHFKHLNETIDKKPSLSEMTRRFGVFANQQERSYDLPSIEREAGQQVAVVS
jgi:hypothetical protein